MGSAVRGHVETDPFWVPPWRWNRALPFAVGLSPALAPPRNGRHAVVVIGAADHDIIVEGITRPQTNLHGVGDTTRSNFGGARDACSPARQHLPQPAAPQTCSSASFRAWSQKTRGRRCLTIAHLRGRSAGSPTSEGLAGPGLVDRITFSEELKSRIRAVKERHAELVVVEAGPVLDAVDREGRVNSPREALRDGVVGLGDLSGRHAEPGQLFSVKLRELERVQHAERGLALCWARLHSTSRSVGVLNKVSAKAPTGERPR
jgi:hypothetical protein